MPFSESLKQEVRKKAAFRCCRCQNIGIDVHHIIPESEGGPSDFDNAAPLCQNCHDQFGGNPQKRKEIREMRDWWYEKCESETFSDKSLLVSKLEDINKTVNDIQAGQQELMPDLRAYLRQLFEQSLQNITPNSSAVFASEIVSATTGVSKFTQCSKCGKNTSILYLGLCEECYRNRK